MTTPDSNDTLETALADWRVAAKTNPQFRAEVWRRIEAAETAERVPWATYARRHMAGVAAALALAVAAGAAGGQERAKARAAADSARLAAVYVEALDARSGMVQAARGR